MDKHFDKLASDEDDMMARLKALGQEKREKNSRNSRDNSRINIRDTDDDLMARINAIENGNDMRTKSKKVPSMMADLMPDMLFKREDKKD